MIRLLLAPILVGAIGTVPVGPWRPPVPPSKAYALVDDGVRISSYGVAESGVLAAADFAPHDGSYLPVWPVGNPARGLLHAVIVKSGPHTGYPDSQVLGTYRIEPGTGVLTEVQVLRLGETKNEEAALAVHPSGAFVFLEGGGQNGIRRYAVDESTGALTLLGTTSAPSFDAPGGLEVHPAGDWLFASYRDLRGAGQLDTYRVDRATGQLTLAHRSPLARPLYRMRVDPSGRFLFGLDQADSLWSHSIDMGSGRLTVLQRVSAGWRPRDLVLMDRLLFVAATNSDEVRCLEKNPDTGTLRDLGVVAQLQEVESLAVHPSGHVLYVGHGRWGREVIDAYAIDPSSAGLKPLGTVAEGQTIRIIEARP